MSETDSQLQDTRVKQPEEEISVDLSSSSSSSFPLSSFSPLPKKRDALSLVTSEEAYRIVQEYSLGIGLVVYTIFIFSTGNVLATALSFVRIVRTTRVVISSPQDLAQDEALGWASLFTAILQWIAALVAFIWYHVLCRKCSRENFFRASVSKCVQLSTVAF